jgi:hypothetical protein
MLEDFSKPNVSKDSYFVIDESTAAMCESPPEPNQLAQAAKVAHRKYNFDTEAPPLPLKGSTTHHLSHSDEEEDTIAGHPSVPMPDSSESRGRSPVPKSQTSGASPLVASTSRPNIGLSRTSRISPEARHNEAPTPKIPKASKSSSEQLGYKMIDFRILGQKRQKNSFIHRRA